MDQSKVTNILNRLTSYLVHNDIVKHQMVYLTARDKLIEKTTEHGGMLIFKFRTEDILYNPHKFNDNQIKELSLLVPEYKFEPVVSKDDTMFYTGFEML